jgi:uncharacterized protein YdeI (YjbR/CyaY-like superfamily)
MKSKATSKKATSKKAASKTKRSTAERSTDADDVRFFATAEKWRQWLEKNHERATELWVGMHKKASGTPSITWPEAVDEALCFGWIDGIRKSIDETRYKNRFTPRKKGSNWSAVNIARVAALTKEGRMHPAGLTAFEGRDPKKSGVYSFEQREAATLGDEFERRFRANAKAWAFFEAQPPYYRRVTTFWVVSAKQQATRERRLGALIADSAAGRRIGLLKRPGE